MSKIKICLNLPGEQKKEVAPIANGYVITVERDDGIACSELEAKTAMSMLCIEIVTNGLKKPRKTKKKPETKEIT